MRYIDTERQLVNIFTKPLDASCFADLGGGGLVFAIRMAWFEGELVLFPIYCLFCVSLAFSSHSPKSPCFTCYTNLYLLNYVYHYARMSSNKM
jgi:hypothetical protein